MKSKRERAGTRRKRVTFSQDYHRENQEASVEETRWWGAGRGRFPSDRGGAPDQLPKWGCFGGHFCIFAGWKHLFLLQSANLTRKALLVSGRRTTWHPFPAGDAGVRVRPLRNLFLVRTENRTSPNHFNTLLTLHIPPVWAKRWALSI